LLWSRINGPIGGVLMMIAGLAALFLPPSPLKPVLLMLAFLALFQSRLWLGGWLDRRGTPTSDHSHGKAPAE